MTFRILLSPPDVGELEEEYVLDAIRSGWVAPAGPDLNAFEREVAERVGVSYAVGLSSGTAALHLALVSWGVGPGDVVPVSTFTFAATVNAIRYVGATPHFIDCDPDSGNMDPGLLQRALEEIVATGRRVPVVIPVDMLGKCADHSEIDRVLDGFPGVRVLSDAAESFGATHSGRPAGGFGDAAVLSFNGNKIMTTSGGGMLLTEDGALADARAQAVHPGTGAGAALRAHRSRLQLPAVQHPGRARAVPSCRRLDAMMARRREWRERYRGLFALDRAFGSWAATTTRRTTAGSPRSSLTREVSGWSAAAISAAGSAKPGSRPGRCGSRCTCSRCTPGCPARLDGTSNRLFAGGLTLPSGSAMADEQFARVEERDREGTGA